MKLLVLAKEILTNTRELEYYLQIIWTISSYVNATMFMTSNLIRRITCELARITYHLPNFVRFGILSDMKFIVRNHICTFVKSTDMTSEACNHICAFVKSTNMTSEAGNISKYCGNITPEMTDSVKVIQKWSNIPILDMGELCKFINVDILKLKGDIKQSTIDRMSKLLTECLVLIGN